MYIAVVTIVVAITLLQCSSATEFNIEVPPECKDKVICDQKPVGYPSQEIDAIVKETQMKSNVTLVPEQEYFNEDYEAPPPDGLNCELEVKVYTPYIIRVKTSWRMVVQSQYFTQKIREVRCNKERESCMEMNSYLSSLGKTATCMTKYTTIFLKFYDPIAKEIQHLSTPVAVCCACNIEDAYKK